MMKKILHCFFLITSITSFAQSPIEKGLASINRQDAETYITILASDSLEGRKGGQPGGEKAAEYLKNILEEVGVKPWRSKYIHPFTPNRYRDSKGNEVKLQNVLGYIPGKNSSEIVIVGAHFDHLGIRVNETNDSIYNGADDNASGVSAVLQIARAFITSGEKPERTVMFGLWDGEEMGLLGSFHFVDDHFSYIPIPLTDPIAIKGYINCDMIGRNKDGDGAHVSVYYSDNTPILKDWIEQDIKSYHLKLIPDYPSLDDSPGGSDHMPFEQKGVPFIFLHTDLHPDYHKASDEADKINYDKVVDITKLAFLNLWNMANSKEF